MERILDWTGPGEGALSTQPPTPPAPRLRRLEFPPRALGEERGTRARVAGKRCRVL